MNRLTLWTIALAVLLATPGCGVVMDAQRSALLDSTIVFADAQAAAAVAGQLAPDQSMAALVANDNAWQAFASAPWYQVLANPTYRQLIVQTAALSAETAKRAKAGQLTLPQAAALLQAEAESFHQLRDAKNGIATQPTPVSVIEREAIHKPLLGRT